MAKQAKPKLVQCRYPKCSKLHETTSLPKEEAVTGGKKNYYYHPDCYHTMQTVSQIRDIFCKEVNTMITGKQIGQLVSIVNNLVFEKGISVDFVLFALKWFIVNKPGKLRYPGGITYIVQNRDVAKAWDKEQKQKAKEELKGQVQTLLNGVEKALDIDFLEEDDFVYKPKKQTGFEDILK